MMQLLINGILRGSTIGKGMNKFGLCYICKFEQGKSNIMLYKHSESSFIHNPVLYMMWENMVSSCLWLRMHVIDCRSEGSWNAFNSGEKLFMN